MLKKHKKLSQETVQMVADRFKVMSDPMRLQILSCLTDGELSVMEIVDSTGAGQPNVSKHLKLLRQAGLLSKRKDGNQVYYEIADESIFELCELVCDSLERRLNEQSQALSAA